MMSATPFSTPFLSGKFADEIPLSDIDIPGGKAPRNLLRSIREQGLIEPPVLVEHPYGDQRYGILAGIRRLQSIREIDPNATVVAIIRCDAQASPGVTIAENLVRSRNVLAELEAYVELKRQSLSDEDIQKSLGLFKRDVKTLAVLRNVCPSGKTALREGKLAPSSAMVLAKMKASQQEAYFDEHPDAVSKYTLASVKEWRMRQLLPDAQLSFLADMPLA